jgi:cytochrome c oxidase assembly factor CtaG/putative copper export protein
MRLAAILLIALASGVAVLIWALNFGGGLNAPAIADPGTIVRFGLPISKVLFEFSSAIAIGTLVFAAFALNETDSNLAKALNLAAGASAAWFISGLAYFVFTYASVSGTPISTSNAFGSGLWLFATSIEMGRSIALNIIGGAFLSILALTVRRLTATFLLAALGLAALIPLALIGHSAGTRGHAMAVNSIGMHLWAVTVWVGGLVALLALKSTDSNHNTILAKRFSSLALVSFILVAISGVGSASVRLEKPEDLLTNYGLLLIAKVAFLIILGVFGAVYRLSAIKRIAVESADGSGRTSSFWRLASVEIAIMAMAMGLATALSRTATPVANETINPTPAYLLTGEQLPPELTAASFLSAWKIDLVWLVITLGSIWFYLAGVRRLNRRGDKWPWLRTASWITGMLTLLYVTNGAINVYQEYLFSIHMIGHMILAMAIPVLLVPGAPVTLLMRSVEARHDGSRGAREWVLWAVHTKYAQFIAHPIVAAVLFASSLVTFYYTPLFRWATSQHLGHQWMVVHFLITGYLFAQALIGIDPGPKRLGFPLRLLMLIGTMAFHAFFGLSLMDGSGLLLPDWYGAMGRTWGENPLDDQHTGGAIAWGIGELPTAALTLIVCVQWFKSDSRESRRLDRASDRSGNQDIEAYNQMLARLAGRDER